MEGLITHLEACGYNVTYLYASYDHFAKKENLNTYKHGVRIKVPSYKKNLSIQRLLSHIVFSMRVREQVKKLSPDLMYCMIPPNSLVMTLSKYKKRHLDTKLVYDVYDAWPESFPYSKKTKLLKIPFSFWKKIRSKYISVADLIMCVSEQGRKAILSEAGATPVKVVKPVIVSGSMPNYKATDDRLSFCYLGMVNHITDIDLGVELLGKIAEKKPTSLHIIGEGQNLDEFVSKLTERNVEVVCHGCVFDREEKNKIFELCNMGLNIPRKEIDSTMSLKAVEYMRVGLPFVNNANGDIREIVEEDMIGLNFEGSINELAEKVLLLNEDDLVDMHKKCEKSYNDRFLSQNYDEILGGLMR